MSESVFYALFFVFVALVIIWAAAIAKGFQIIEEEEEEGEF